MQFLNRRNFQISWSFSYHLIYLSALAESESKVTDITDWFFDTYSNAPGFTVCTGYLTGSDNLFDVQLSSPCHGKNIQGRLLEQYYDSENEVWLQGYTRTLFVLYASSCSAYPWKLSVWSVWGMSIKRGSDWTGFEPVWVVLIVTHIWVWEWSS